MASRSERLKERLLASPFTVCAERAVLWTRAQREAASEPAVVRNALSLQRVLERMTVTIADDELIVGNRTRYPRGAPLFPETKSLALEAQLDTLGRRPIQPYQVGPEEARDLRRILPYWRGRTAWDRAFELMPRELQRDALSFTYTIEAEFANGIGHFILGNPKLLRLGLTGIRAEAQARLDAAPDPDARAFLAAVIIAADAGIAFAARFASLARRQAAAEPEPARRAELRTIADVCERVPARPPTGFHEAVQAVWFNQLIAQLECGGFAISPGRLDQLLAPYYQRDLDSGRITPEAAQELLECLFVKMSGVVNVLDSLVLPVTSGPPIAQSLTIGGTGRDGRDATGPTTRLILAAFDAIRTVSPNLAVRFHPGTPEDFTLAVCDAVRRGAMMALFNDEAVVPAMRASGVAEPDARDYAIVGCVEPAAPGLTFGSTDSNLVNIARCLDLALHDGNGPDLIANRRALARRTAAYLFPCAARSLAARAPHYLMLGHYLAAMGRRLRLNLVDLHQLARGKKLGPSTGDPRGFKDLDAVIAAFQAQVESAVSSMVRAMACCDQAHAELKPTPFISSAIDDCIARGRDVTGGGARYNFTGPQAVGLADVADALAAIQALVFEQGKVSMSELIDAIDADFRGAEPLRQLLLSRAPKYGNGDEAADERARRAAAVYCDEVAKHLNYRGGRYQPGIYSMSAHLVFGILTRALPDGRRWGDSLAAGVSPHAGRELAGPTAVMRSAARIDNSRVANGSVLNLSFDPELLAGPNLAKFAALNRSYFALGGLQVQHNVVSASTLAAAQRDPARHRGLVVRVAGYSALFTELDPATQDDIIGRIAHACD